MKKRMIELNRRLEHFQWILNRLSKSDEVLYLEKDWYDTPTLISKEDAKKEVGQIQKELELLQKRSLIRCILKLLHRFIKL
ncbi:hypothetical protein ACERC8_01550 [Streptococcus sp. E29BA]|uniref:hypothetical protein n=1 Tax=Streptococcus sp. E29BA TaxID=3278716 RepID=UPI00359E7E44